MLPGMEISPKASISLWLLQERRVSAASQSVLNKLCCEQRALRTVHQGYLSMLSAEEHALFFAHNTSKLTKFMAASAWRSLNLLKTKQTKS